MAKPRSRRARTAGALGALLLAGCAPPGPEPAAPDIARLGRPLSGEYLQLRSVSPRLVEIDASGRIVKAAAPGRCIPIDSIRTGPHAVFLLLAECPGAAPGPGDGVFSLSVSGSGLPLAPPALEAFLRSPEGLAELGHGGPGARLLSLDTAEGATVAVVEHESGAAPPFGGPLIARAFVEINGRLTIATLMNRRGATEPAEALRARLAALVAGLRAANA